MGLPAYVVTEECLDVKDKTCLTVCPVDCIYEGGRMTYIDPGQCIDCGACEPFCPQQAIYYEPDVPERLLTYVGINAEFATGLGDVPNARDVDVTDRDHAHIEAMAVRD